MRGVFSFFFFWAEEDFDITLGEKGKNTEREMFFFLERELANVGKCGVGGGRAKGAKIAWWLKIAGRELRKFFSSPSSPLFSISTRELLRKEEEKQEEEKG